MYAKEHFKSSLWEYYKIDATDQDYYDICEMISRKIDCTLMKVMSQDGEVQEVYRVLFKGYVMPIIYSFPQRSVIAILPSIY